MSGAVLERDTMVSMKSPATGLLRKARGECLCSGSELVRVLKTLQNDVSQRFRWLVRKRHADAAAVCDLLSHPGAARHDHGLAEAGGLREDAGGQESIRLRFVGQHDQR